MVTELYLHADEITGSTLRAAPIGRVEALINTPAARVTSGRLVGPLIALAARGSDRDVPMSELRQRVPDTLPTHDHPREPLTRPDGTDPDGFSRRVAEAYSAVVLTTSKPAKVLAEEAGVPVTTVHRWIREARRRGHLPPARRGRAG